MEAVSRAPTPNHHTGLAIASPHDHDADPAHTATQPGGSLVADLERAAVSRAGSAAVAAAAVALDSGRNSSVLASSHPSHPMSLFAFSGPLMSTIEARAGDSERAASPNRAAAALSALLAGDRPLDSPKHQAHMSSPESIQTVAQSLQSLPHQHMDTSGHGQSSLHSAALEALTTPSGSDAQLLGGSSIGTPQGKYSSVEDLHTPNSDSLLDSAHSMSAVFDHPDPRLQHPLSGRSQDSPKSPSNKRHKCQFCSTVFTRHHNLKSHLLTHSQEKPFRCEACHASFRRLHDLKRHNKLHTGEKPHKCNRCGRPFARGDALARHTKGPGGCAGRRSSFGLEDARLGRGMRSEVNGVNSSTHMTDIDLHHDHSVVSKLTTSLPTDSSMVVSADNYGRESAYPTSATTATMYASQVGGPAAGQDVASQAQDSALSFASATSAGLSYSPVMAHSRPLSPSQSVGDPNSQSRSSYNRMMLPTSFQALQGASSLQSIPSDGRLVDGSGAPTPTTATTPYTHARSPLPTDGHLDSDLAFTTVSGQDDSAAVSAAISTALSEQDMTSSHLEGQQDQQMDSGSLVDDQQGPLITTGGTDINTHLLTVIKDLQTQVTQMRGEYERKVKDLQEEVTVLQGQLTVDPTDKESV